MASESWGRAVAELKGRCALCLFVVITGCTSTTTTQTVSSPVAEPRTRVEQAGSVVTSQWMFEGSQITGHVNWATCLSQRSWTTEEQRTVRRNPIPLAGWGLVVGGLALGGVGVASRDSSPPEGACPTDPVAYDFQMLYGPHCGASPDNQTSNIEILTGALAAVAGIGVLALRPSEHTQTLKSQPHADTNTGPCISPADLATLVLVLKVGENRFLRVVLAPNGDATIALPSSGRAAALRLNPGDDLPIVVYRAPRAAASLLQKWQVVGTVHVPE